MSSFNKKSITLVAIIALITAVLGWLALVPAKRPGIADAGEQRIDNMKRVTPAQYQNIIRDLFGSEIQIHERFVDSIEREAGLLAIGATNVSVSPVGFNVAEKMARDIASQVVGTKHRMELVDCQPLDNNTFDEICAKQFITRSGRLLYRRPLTEAELQTQLQVAKLAASDKSDFYAGLEKSLSYLLMSPYFLFRVEYSEPDPDRSGDYRLTAFSKASRLSFLLWNSTPDDLLLTAAERGELHTRKGLQREVDRMLDAPWLADGVTAFFDDMLALDGFDTLAKDAEIFPDFTTQAALDAREQTLRTLVDHLIAKERDYRDLFTTRNTWMTPSLAAVYGVPLVQIRRNRAAEHWVPYTFSENDPRAGILAQSSFVALHSYPGRTSPTLRGKALREHLLCQEVPLPPADVNFNVVEDNTNPDFKTMRQRLGAHVTNPTCAGCHKITDPIGLALESFDGIGRYRDTENGVQIDASGEIDGVAYQDAVGLGEALRNNPAIVSCVVNRLYAYGTGSVVESQQRKWLKSVRKDFAKAGYRFRTLLRVIASSEQFYRGVEHETEAVAGR